MLGQPIDGPHNGPAPGPWDLQAHPTHKFKDATTCMEVPHTASVKVGIMELIGTKIAHQETFQFASTCILFFSPVTSVLALVALGVTSALDKEGWVSPWKNPPPAFISWCPQCKLAFWQIVRHLLSSLSLLCSVLQCVCLRCNGSGRETYYEEGHQRHRYCHTCEGTGRKM